MAPTRPSTSNSTGLTSMVTRLRAGSTRTAAVTKPTNVQAKRKAETTLTANIAKKRSAFGDLTNAIAKTTEASKAKGKALKNKKPSLARPSIKATLPPEPIIPEPIEEKTVFYSPEKEIVKEKAPLPPGVEDFDQECGNDPFQLGNYACKIFEYFREREEKYLISRYLERQTDISREMRAVLVDWLVEVQESFELNHETLYTAVKLVDLYLSRKTVSKETLQLVGTAAMLISCKFEERCPPFIDDFLYICDDAYTRRELLRMEIDVLKTVGFDIGIPLSYSFLRRYARVAKSSMETLTLARYILEMSLMEYDLVDLKDSLISAAALLLAFQIQKLGPWTPTLQYYSTYSESELVPTAQRLLAMLKKEPSKNLKTIRSKYSHKVFFSVATFPLPDKLDL